MMTTLHPSWQGISLVAQLAVLIETFEDIPDLSDEDRQRTRIALDLIVRTADELQKELCRQSGDHPHPRPKIKDWRLHGENVVRLEPRERNDA